MANKNILVTGASGFLGSFVVEGGLARGYNVWAGIRKTSSRANLQSPGTRFMELDFAHGDVLRCQLEEHKARHGCFDYIVHCAGVTKCIDKDDFMQVNYEQTKAFVETLRGLDMQPELFVFVSSLSVFGALHEDDYSPVTDQDTPQPNTAYGVSKLKAEEYLRSLDDFPTLILRPTGVYGPREKDYYLMAKSIKQHVDFSVGYKRQVLTFVYVKDVVQAIFLGMEKKVAGKSFFLTDGKMYQSRTFSDLIIRELGIKHVLRLRCPIFLLKVVSLCAEWLASRRGVVSTLNADKYKIMKQRNWKCDITPAQEELGYQPQYDLRLGVRETVAWYREQGWL